MIEGYLNRSPDADVKGLSTILLLLKADAVPSLCSLLANLTSPVHQAIVSEALVTLAKDHPDPLLRGLSDRRPGYVRNLLSILIKWNNPKFADSIERLTRYPDAQVRREVVRALGLFRPNGNGSKLVSLSTDEDDGVRFAALKLLMSGQYTVPFSQWSPLLSEEGFMDRPISERRAIFQAVRATCGDEAVPYWQGLMTEWAWTNRKKKEELAVLGAETLGKLATPAAIAALSLGAKKEVPQFARAAPRHCRKLNGYNAASPQPVRHTRTRDRERKPVAASAKPDQRRSDPAAPDTRKVVVTEDRSRVRSWRHPRPTVGDAGIPAHHTVEYTD